MCCLLRVLIPAACLGLNLFPGALAAAQFDWGDAPASYATRLAQNGPRHEITATLRLGKRIDAEPNGLASPDGTGDDADGLDDEDGIISVTPMILGVTTTVKFESSAAGFLDAWIDFNRDGDFADAGEKVAHALALVAGTNTLNLAIPAAASLGETAVRLRLSSVGGLNFDGPALDGEVEDHRVTLLPAQPAWGTHPRAYYADGQVWVVWDVDTNNLPETYAIYASPAPMTNTTQATLVGRLFDGEYFRPNLLSDVEFTFGSRLLSGYNILGGEGTTNQLKATQGLFVDTVRASGRAYYAVVPHGQTTVSPDERTTNTVSFTFSTHEPPRPHLQVRSQDPTGHNLSRYRNDRSYPAFYNLLNHPNHRDPGPGAIGGRLNACAINLQNGDDHDTWGGYFDWDTAGISDTSTNWAGTLWLVGLPAISGYAAVDEYLNESLTADVALRRPQNFKPMTGSRLVWQLTRIAENRVRQSGETIVGPVGLVAVPGLHIAKDPQRVRLAKTPQSSTATPAFLTQRILPSEYQSGLLWRSVRGDRHRPLLSGHPGERPQTGPAGGFH